MASGIPEPVRHFIAQHVESVEQLEVLLHLRAHADRAWTADEVAQALHIDAASAARRLDDLCGRGVLAAAEESPRRYRYSPALPAVDAVVGSLAEAYATRRVSVISLIFAKPTDTIQTFADAFRIRRDD